jgi:hypothetical protein
MKFIKNKTLLEILIFIPLFLYSCSSSIGIFNETTENIQHEYLLNFNDSSQTQTFLFEKCMLWISKNWKITKYVVEYKDKDAGQISLMGFIDNAISSFADSSLDFDIYGSMTNAEKARYLDKYHKNVASWEIEFFPLSFKMIILTRNQKVKIEFVQTGVVKKVHNLNETVFFTNYVEYKNSKLLHYWATRRYNMWIKDLEKELRINNF